MKVERVDENNYNKAFEFLKSTSKINEVVEEIVRNASVIMDEEQVVGILSYEKFNEYSLVRYFVFKKSIPSEIVLELLNDIKDKIKSTSCKALLTIITADDVKEMFISLGFQELDKDKVFIDEVKILETKFKDAYILRLDI